MNHKERMLRSLTHQPVDRIPTQINYTDKQGLQLADHFKVPITELPERLDNHMIRVDLNYSPGFNRDHSIKYDWWGVGFDTGEEGYFVRHSPLETDPDLDHYPWPDPNAPELLDSAQQIMADDHGEHFIAPNLGFILFERAWSLRGFANFFMDMVRDPGYVEALLDRITDIQLALIQRYIDLGVDGGYFGDDYGGQDTMLFSPVMWRRYIKPRLARLFAPFTQAGLPIIMHSDGRIQQILPDLVEIGLTTYNPVQPEVTDHAWLRQTFGDSLSYYGGVSTQTVLPFGTPAEVKSAVHACAQTLAPEGTGLLIAPSHRMMSDIPMVNVEALLTAFKELGTTSDFQPD